MADEPEQLVPLSLVESVFRDSLASEVSRMRANGKHDTASEVDAAVANAINALRLNLLVADLD